jgi:hypothetical protein
MENEPEFNSKLVPEEEEGEEPYTFENLSVSFLIDNRTVDFFTNVMQITEDGFTFLQEKSDDQWFTIFGAFSNTTSVGISDHSLMVFMGDQEMDEEEETPEVIKIISLSPPGGNVSLIGYNFTISIDFGKEGQNVLKEVHDIFVNYMGDAAEDRLSQYDEDVDF